MISGSFKRDRKVPRGGGPEEGKGLTRLRLYPGRGGKGGTPPRSHVTPTFYEDSLGNSSLFEDKPLKTIGFLVFFILDPSAGEVFSPSVFDGGLG